MKDRKSSCLAVAIITLGLTAAQEIRTEACSPSDSSRSKIVIGEVSEVDGEFRMARTPHGEDTLDIVDKAYVITDQAGMKLRLELSDDTDVPQRVNPGDKIEAKISSEGHTLSVTRLN